MRPKGSAEVLEQRRRRALKLLRDGLSLREVGERVGCDASSVMRWRDAWKRKGEEAFQVGKSPGRPRKLGARERARLIKVLVQGAAAHGYRTDLWTTARVAEVIERSFGVGYHRDHVGRVLHQLGFSHQKPERRAIERDEVAIQRWKQRDWPRIKKKRTD